MFQNGVLDAEEVVFSHYVICNDTQEVLRFGQVDTDENILLQSNQSHQYSWRTHKSPQVRLYVRLSLYLSVYVSSVSVTFVCHCVVLKLK